jgi:hypothetical protein
VSDAARRMAGQSARERTPVLVTEFSRVGISGQVLAHKVTISVLAMNFFPPSIPMNRCRKHFFISISRKDKCSSESLSPFKL